MRPEHWLYTIPRRLRSLFRWAQADLELDDELRDHLERKTEEYVAQGITQEEARRRARLDLGGVEKVKEDCRDARGINFIDTLYRDIRYCVRVLSKSPANTLLVLCLLGIGIGANTSIFSLVNALYFKAVPVSGPTRLVRIYAKRFRYGAGFSKPEYLSLRESMASLAGLAAETRVAQLHLIVDNEAREVEGFFVTSNYLSLLDLRPAAGRFFLPEEDAAPDRNPVVVISHRLWRSQFGGSEAAIGREIKVNLIPLKVIGVMPTGFSGDVAGEAGDLWMPTMMMPSMGYTCAGSFACTVFDRLIGRLAPGNSIDQARAEVSARIVWSATDAKDKQPRQTYVSRATGVDPDSADEFRSQMRLLIAGAGTLLLIVCANLAGLFLVRGLGRRKEVAVRLAIGANRGRIARQLLTESLLLAVAGGVLGLVLSLWGRGLLASFYTVDSEGFFHAYDLALDWRVVLYSLALVFTTGVLFGLGPALHACRQDPISSLKEGSGAVGPRSRWLRQALVCGQVALSLVLLVSAALLVRSGRTLSRGTNFDPRQVVLLRLRPELLHFNTSQNEAYFRKVVEQVQSMPSVESATMIQGGTGLIWKWDSGRSITVHVPGQPQSVNNTDSGILYHAVGPRFFETLRIPILQGRAIDESDNNSAPLVAVLNRTLASHLWPYQSAVGQTLVVNGKPAQVIGIAADIQPQSSLEAPAPYVYLSFWQSAPGKNGDLRMAIRVKGDPAAELPNLRRVIRALNAEVPLGEDMPMTEQISLTYVAVLLARSVMSCCGVLALCLSAIGLYSVLAFSVRSRAREIGIRMALGANREQVVHMVLREGLRVGALGLAAGFVAAVIATRLLANCLFGVGSLDVVSFTVGNILLLATALLASYLPSQRAAKVDPMVALRYE